MFKPPTTLKQSLVKLKARIAQERKKTVVYQIPCGDCDEVHVGETKRTLNASLSEHRQQYGGETKNGIAVHVQQSQHAIKWGRQKWRRWYQDTGREEHGKSSWSANSLHLPSVWNPLLNTPPWSPPLPFLLLPSVIFYPVFTPIFPSLPIFLSFHPTCHQSSQHPAWRHLVPVFKHRFSHVTFSLCTVDKGPRGRNVL